MLLPFSISSQEFEIFYLSLVNPETPDPSVGLRWYPQASIKNNPSPTFFFQTSLRIVPGIKGKSVELRAIG